MLSSSIRQAVLGNLNFLVQYKAIMQFIRGNALKLSGKKRLKAMYFIACKAKSKNKINYHWDTKSSKFRGINLDKKLLFLPV